MAETADAIGDHATAPALLVDLQVQLGRLAELSQEATERGRRPFRVPPGWEAALGELAYLVYLLADQTGVDASAQVVGAATAHRDQAPTTTAMPQEPATWPFTS